MPNISMPEAQAWLEPTKLTLSALDAELESSSSVRVLGSLARVYDVSGWTTPETTPILVRKIIAMLYAGELYNRQYSEDYDGSSYGDRLIAMAMTSIQGIADGSVDLIDVEVPASTTGSPSFYPNDDAGALDKHEDAKFTMGRVW